MNDKAITIKSAEIFREGITKGKAWTLIKFSDHEDVKYKTFEKEVLQGIGRPARIFYTEEKRDWTNPEGKVIPVIDRMVKTVVWDETAMPASEMSQFKQGIAEDHVVALVKRVDALEAEIKALKGKPVDVVSDKYVGGTPGISTTINLESEVKEEDLPF